MTKEEFTKHYCRACCGRCCGSSEAAADCEDVALINDAWQHAAEDTARRARAWVKYYDTNGGRLTWDGWQRDFNKNVLPKF